MVVMLILIHSCEGHIVVIDIIVIIDGSIKRRVSIIRSTGLVRTIIGSTSIVIIGDRVSIAIHEGKAKRSTMSKYMDLINNLGRHGEGCPMIMIKNAASGET